MSIIKFRFKHAPKKWDSITFQGIACPVLQAKQLIAQERGLIEELNGGEIDLLIKNSTTQQGLLLLACLLCIIISLINTWICIYIYIYYNSNIFFHPSLPFLNTTQIRFESYLFYIIVYIQNIMMTSL